MQEESTTPDLAALARRNGDAFCRRDFDAGMADFAEDAVWDMTALGMGVAEGREAIRRFFDDWVDTFEDWEQELEEVHNLGSGVTFAVAHQRGRLRGSGSSVALRYAIATTWANGVIEWQAAYADINEARAAAERLAAERG